jgi:hypothetical protein
MSWSELQRLVEDAERDAEIRRGLRRCRSRRELLLACGRLGYRIQAIDLRRAWLLDRKDASSFSPAGQGNWRQLRQAGDSG